MMELVNHDVINPRISSTQHQMLKLEEISDGCRGCKCANNFTSSGSVGYELANRIGEDEIKIDPFGEEILLVYLQ